MAELLFFQLLAPFAAFGTVAVGERRETAMHPAHSALAGLLAAALGLERSAPGIEALTANFAFAVRADKLGPPLPDFHTAQTPPARTGKDKGKGWASRRDELSGNVNTILSRRDYRCDCGFTVAVMERAPSPAEFSLAAIAERLCRPHFTLYIGRKSCPLGAPPDPRIIACTSLTDGFAAYDKMRVHKPASANGTMSLDPAFVTVGLFNRTGISRSQSRRDWLVSRRGWRFDLREELTAHSPDPEVTS